MEIDLLAETRVLILVPQVHLFQWELVNTMMLPSISLNSVIGHCQFENIILSVNRD